MTGAGDTAAGISVGRRAFLPPPALPLVYFAGSHVSLAFAFGALIARPDVPGGFHYHPQLVALVHLVTLGWISGSVLGAFYIVAPLALGMPFRATWRDAVACASFWTGIAAMVAGFWSGRFDLVAAASALVIAPLAFVGARAMWALRRTRLPLGVSLHVSLAFANVVGGGLMGLVLAGNRLTGDLPWSPLSLAVAHGHLAVLGWATMMIFGIAYRLIPMFVPAAMPPGRGLSLSAVLLQIGTLGLTWSLVAETAVAPWALLVVGAFGSFFVQVRRIVRQRRPRPADMPRRDWSTWHTHLALLYLVIAAVLGLWLTIGAPAAVTWAYGIAGLLGFVGQMVVGIQGRLLPLLAWYRAMERLDGAPPAVSAHRLIEPRLALTILVLWTAGLPLLTAGLVGEWPALIASGAALLLSATGANAWQGALMVLRAGKRE